MTVGSIKPDYVETGAVFKTAPVWFGIEANGRLLYNFNGRRYANAQGKQNGFYG
jgi:hypothetical protein